MRIFIETQIINDDEFSSEKWITTKKFRNTKQSKDEFTLTKPKLNTRLREHLCDHDEPEGSPLKTGCKINEKENRSGKVKHTSEKLRKHFEQFSNEIEEDETESERKKQSHKIDRRMKVD